MKAVEIRAKTIQPQYESILAIVEHEVTDGRTLAANFRVIYPEVIEMLLDEGFDIEVATGINDETLNYAVSCVNAAEGRRGELTKKSVIPEGLDKIIGGIMGPFGCDYDDDDDDDDDDEFDEDDSFGVDDDE